MEFFTLVAAPTLVGTFPPILDIFFFVLFPGALVSNEIE